jgi:tRNA pseudouridine32 synthase / 23S rRNA pseudouridine746 synthase
MPFLDAAFSPVYADGSLIVVNKPAGLLSVPGRGADKQDALSRHVQAHYTDALIVHRLDQPTSGLMIMARGAAMQRALNMAFESRAVHKHYVAVVQGIVQADSGDITAPLRADWPARPRQMVDADAGKPSHTHWQVLARNTADNTTRLLLEPLTGRTHQLRVHCMSIGHPIVGDALYGDTHHHNLVHARLMLHAQQLALLHPLTMQVMQWKCPADF